MGPTGPAAGESAEPLHSDRESLAHRSVYFPDHGAANRRRKGLILLLPTAVLELKDLNFY